MSKKEIYDLPGREGYGFAHSPFLRQGKEAQRAAEAAVNYDKKAQARPGFVVDAGAARISREEAEYYIDKSMEHAAELKAEADAEDPPSPEVVKKRRAANLAAKMRREKARKAREAAEYARELQGRMAERDQELGR